MQQKTEYFTRFPNNYIQGNIKTKYGVSRKFYITYILIDKYRSYEDYSWITLRKVLNFYGYKTHKRRPKAVQEILDVLEYMINNKMIEVQQDLDTLGYDTGIEIKIIPENFDAVDKFSEITSSQLDFIMMSDNFKNSTRLSYVNDSYKAYGNNGDCLDKDVKDPDCTGIYSQTLRNNLYNMSDHLPVVAQFKIHESLSTKTIDSKPFIWLQSSTITNEKITIGIDKSRLNAQNNTLFIYNSVGQLVQPVPLNNQSSITIDCQTLASGVYYIKTKESNEVLKFIKK